MGVQVSGVRIITHDHLCAIECTRNFVDVTYCTLCLKVGKLLEAKKRYKETTGTDYATTVPKREAKKQTKSPSKVCYARQAEAEAG